MRDSSDGARCANPIFVVAASSSKPRVGSGVTDEMSSVSAMTLACPKHCTCLIGCISGPRCEGMNQSACCSRACLPPGHTKTVAYREHPKINFWSHCCHRIPITVTSNIGSPTLICPPGTSSHSRGRRNVLLARNPGWRSPTRLPRAHIQHPFRMQKANRLETVRRTRSSSWRHLHPSRGWARG